MLCFIVLCILGVFIFAGQGVFYLTMLVMLTNTIEYDEWQTGQRNDAVTFSVRPFMVKLAGAIQYLIVAVTLVVCGLYSITQEIGKIETEIAGNIISKENGTAIIEGLLGQATTGQMLGLSASMTLIPVILFIVEYIIIKKKYIITEEFYEKIVKEIITVSKNGEITANVNRSIPISSFIGKSVSQEITEIDSTGPVIDDDYNGDLIVNNDITIPIIVSDSESGVDSNSFVVSDLEIKIGETDIFDSTLEKVDDNNYNLIIKTIIKDKIIPIFLALTAGLIKLEQSNGFFIFDLA